MKKWLVASSLMLALSSALAAGDNAAYFNGPDGRYKYPTVADIKPLSDFKSVQAFEKNYQQVIQKCLDHTMGGSGGIPCNIASDIWNRELNTAYSELMKALSDETAKHALREAQRNWIKQRDLDQKWLLALTNYRYRNHQQGSMYQLMSSGDLDTDTAALVKNRTLLLRQWLKQLHTSVD